MDMTFAGGSAGITAASDGLAFQGAVEGNSLNMASADQGQSVAAAGVPNLGQENGLGVA